MKRLMVWSYTSSKILSSLPQDQFQNHNHFYKKQKQKNWTLVGLSVLSEISLNLVSEFLNNGLVFWLQNTWLLLHGHYGPCSSETVCNKTKEGMMKGGQEGCMIMIVTACE